MKQDAKPEDLITETEPPRVLPSIEEEAHAFYILRRRTLMTTVRQWLFESRLRLLIGGTLGAILWAGMLILFLDGFYFVRRTMEAAPLSEDLKTLAAEPKTLFHASDALWKRPGDRKNYVTDGPCLYRHSCGDLLMLWSSFGTGDYTVGIARSRSGKILGPWTQDDKPLYENGGHCMLFRTFAGETLLALHGPNIPTNERLRLFRVEETKVGLRLTNYSVEGENGPE